MEEVFANAKKYEDIAEKRSVFYGNVDKALEIVKKFILSKDRILYGGMAIDLSLKLSGHEGIYAPDAIPDYDFMSPTHYDDSNELAVILAEAGFDNVSAIHAIHLTSRRVRVNFIPVADITYIPENIYQQVPTLTTKEGMRIVHPDFQRLDMHRAFSTPFEKPPGEVIIQRTKKDIKRFRMLIAQYPLPEQSSWWEEWQTYAKTPSDMKITVAKASLQNAICGGFLAYALFYKFWKAILPHSKTPIIPLECDIEEEHLVLHWGAHFPTFPEIVITTDHYENLLSALKLKHPQYYNKYLDDICPRSIRGKSSEGVAYEILDNCGRLAPVFNLMKLANHWLKLSSKAGAKTNNIWLPQVHLLLMYLLLRSFREGEGAGAGAVSIRKWYRAFYCSLMTMIQDIEEHSTQFFEAGTEKHELIPFFLTATVYGEYNWSPDYINSIREKLAMLAGKRLVSRGPFGFYPQKSEEKSKTIAKSWETPDFSANELFLIDGEKRAQSFIPLPQMFTPS
jgi:hypothetical protein